MKNWLVTTQWLAQHIDDPQIVVLDCSWHLPDTGKFAVDDFLQGHIPGARFADLNVISDQASPYVNMLPDAAHFSQQVGALGVGNETHVVIYDAGYVSARLWWMFRVFGHERVSILDGGWRKWRAEDRSVATGPAEPVAPKEFSAKADHSRIATLVDVKAALNASQTTIVDARTPARFDGTEGSGYPGVPGGYMPGAINTHWGKFFDADNNHVFVSPERAAEVFSEAGADIDGDVITTCGSGVTAAILGFMIEQLGNANWRLYDGSWHEWGQQDDTVKLRKEP
ncbi:sulfurtransferase [Roseovarius aestuarii]|nr:sulfurtransferase [Roseovarius aestuarii]